MNRKNLRLAISGLAIGIIIASCASIPPPIEHDQCSHAWSCKVSRAGLMMVATDPTVSAASRAEAWAYIDKMDHPGTSLHHVRPVLDPE